MSKLISKIVVPDSNEATGYSLYNVKDSGAIHSSDVGVAGGVASLDNAGKVPSSLLPSYVDDVIEGYYHENKFYTTYTPGQEEEDPGTYSGEITAETGKIYVDITTNQSYRWSGSAYIVISSPYVLPTASANTLGGVKVGDNLSIDQNGVLSAQASSPDEVQIGGNTPSSDSDIKIFIDTTEDSTAEIYTKQQQDGKFIVIKDLNAAPTESTLTYTENGTVKNFKQGDEVRVPDAEADNGYTFYKLYELTTSGNTTTATWDKLGAGSAAVLKETVIISLSQQNGNNADLIDTTIVVEDDDSGDTLLSTTWQGYDISLDVESGVTYTITVGSITGYRTPSAQVYQALPTFMRNIHFVFNNANGIYIEDINHNLYSEETWNPTGKTVNGVVVLSANHNFRIPLNSSFTGYGYTNNSSQSGNTGIFSYLSKVTTESAAMNDFDGYGNTQKIIAWAKATSHYASGYIAYEADHRNFPDGTKYHIPSYGEQTIINNNKTVINRVLETLGSSTIAGGWSSTAKCAPGDPAGNEYWDIIWYTGGFVSGTAQPIGAIEGWCGSGGYFVGQYN